MPHQLKEILSQAADIKAGASLGRVEFRLCQENGNGCEFFVATERRMYLGKDKAAAQRLLDKLQLAMAAVTDAYERDASDGA